VSEPVGVRSILVRREAEIERIGVLRNPVISWQEGHGEPPPARVRW